MKPKTAFTPLEMEIYKRSSPTTGQGPYGVNKRFLTGLAKKDLIVVLACIVFLLANIAAIGPRGRRHAKNMLCLSNLHKWGTIFQAFAADNDGYFMQGYIEKDYEGAYRDYWMEALRPYYSNPDLRCCPEATIPGSEIGGGRYGGNGTFTAWGVFTGAWSYAVAGDYGSYGWNGFLGNPPEDFGIWGKYKVEGLDPNWRTANVTGADNIPLFLDHQFVDCWPDHIDEPPLFSGQPWGSCSQMGRFCINRHSGFINSAFLDFSARKVGLKQLWTLKWHRQYNTCGPWTTCGGVTRDDWAHHGTGWMKDLKD